MNNGNRLAWLMNRLNISANHLSLEVGLDNSLLYKWKSDRRSLPRRSDAPLRIARFIVQLDRGRGSTSCLGQIFEDIRDPIEQSPEALSLRLSRWLTGELDLHPATPQSRPADRQAEIMHAKTGAKTSLKTGAKTGVKTV